MKRMPPFLSDCTERFPRISRSTNAAFHAGPCAWKYRTPVYKRMLFAVTRHGWMIVVVALIAAVCMGMTGCVDMESEAASGADLRDAVEQARKGVRP